MLVAPSPRLPNKSLEKEVNDVIKERNNALKALEEYSPITPVIKPSKELVLTERSITRRWFGDIVTEKYTIEQVKVAKA